MAKPTINSNKISLFAPKTWPLEWFKRTENYRLFTASHWGLEILLNAAIQGRSALKKNGLGEFSDAVEISIFYVQ